MLFIKFLSIFHQLFGSFMK